MLTLPAVRIIRWEEVKAADFELEDKVLVRLKHLSLYFPTCNAKPSCPQGQRLSEMSARERVLRLQMEDLEMLLQARQTTAALRARNLSQASPVEGSL